MTAAKHDDYYGLDRSHLYAFAAAVGVRLSGPALNIGCAGGRDAGQLRLLGASELHGVEPVPRAAETASASYDRVDCCSIDDWRWPGNAYDLVVLADVIEHLAAPDRLLERTRGWLSREGSLLISVPNVRHLSVLWSLAVRGDWRYEEEGILDDTHLRFYTSRSVRRLLQGTGYDCVAVDRFGLNPWGRTVSRVVPGAGEFLLSQIYVVARPRPAMRGVSGSTT